MDLKTLGKNIRRARQSRGLTQECASIELGCSLNTYTKIERGETNVPFLRLVQIAEFYEISLTQLVKEANESNARNISAELSDIKNDLLTIKNMLINR